MRNDLRSIEATISPHLSSSGMDDPTGNLGVSPEPIRMFQPLPRRRCTWCVVLATIALCGCGGSFPAAAAASPPVLSATAVSYLPSKVRPLTASDLTHESTAPGLAAGLTRWGYVAGAQRLFQGQSKTLQVVVSRTLEFRSPAGAAAYVAYVHRQATAVFGAVPTQVPLVAGARRGWTITLAPCACHMASPALVGVASAGRRVSWLEVNGPTASVDALTRLLAQAP
jgi:hypothetical protein